MLNNAGFKALQEGNLLYEHIGGVPDPTADKICFDCAHPPFAFDQYHPSNRRKASDIHPSSPKPEVNVDRSTFSIASIPQTSPVASTAPIQSNIMNGAAVIQAVPVNPSAQSPLPVAQPINWQPDPSRSVILSVNNPTAAPVMASPVAAPAPAVVAGTVLSVTAARPAAWSPGAAPPSPTPNLPINAPPAFDTSKPDPLPDIGDPIKEYGPNDEVLSGMKWTNPREEELRTKYSASKKPDVGDILISVNGIPVNHLDSTQVINTILIDECFSFLILYIHRTI
jgi:hypothetical protein